MTEITSWAIEEFGVKNDGIRVAVKDLIDIEGHKTSAGSRLVLSRAKVASEDARCLASIRRGGLAIIGKSNLHELAFGSTGINHWWGTPVNPIDPALVPGGSSSGSAVAVANGFCDFALGTDTGGSIRIPAAACGSFGLKTTWGKVSTVGVHPLAPSLDTIGPMADSMDALMTGYSYMDSDFAPAPSREGLQVGLITTAQNEQMTDIFRAVFTALGYRISEITGIDLAKIHRSANHIMVSEALRADGELLNESHRLDPMVVTRLLSASHSSDHDYRSALDERHRFQNELEDSFENFDLLALATIPSAIPSLAASIGVSLNRNTLPFNFAGTPALSVPIAPEVTSDVLKGDPSPQGGSRGAEVPVSLQLVAPWDREALLLGVGKAMEAKSLLYIRSKR